MKKIILIMTFVSLFILQSTAQYIGAEADKTTANQRMSRVEADCANNNGLAISVSGTSVSQYINPISSLVCNTPLVSYTGAGSWTGDGVAGFVKYTFSQAINCATVTYSAVDGNSDIGQISVNGGGSVVLSNSCGASISGNTLTCNLNGYGNVTVKVSATRPFTVITLTNTGGRTGWVQGNPCNFILTDCISPSSNTGCCPGTNLICNGDFEGPKNCFESRYTGYTGEGILRPGQYAINDYATANKFCKQWNFNEAPCRKTGKGLFINGVTNGVGKKIIWQQQINFNGYAQYRFCADLTPLSQCCFNVVPKLEIKLTYQSGGQTKTVLINQSTPEECSIKYSQAIAQWEGSDVGTASLSITLDESGIGDGNDFVLDNIALIELKQIPKSITSNVTVSPSGNNSITATFNGTLPAGVSSVWTLIPLDNNGNPDASCPGENFWPLTTNFAGFDGCRINGTAPGVLIPGKNYKVLFGTFGTCYAWDQYTFKITADPQSKKMIITKEENIENKSEPMLKGIKNKISSLMNKE